MQTVGLFTALFCAYRIRLHAVHNYGRVIHEFDPWFNYRATEYLLENGVQKFFSWYDDKSWYPLGRPIGTTIYPGLQFTSVALYHAAHWLASLEGTLGRFGAYWAGTTLNDVCVFVPAIFGVVTCIFTFLLTWEVARDATTAVGAAAIMAIIPSHIMRSVAGGYDNESIAVAASVATFYFWVRSLRSARSWPWGLCTAAAYAYMVAAWGGHTFVLNVSSSAV